MKSRLVSGAVGAAMLWVATSPAAAITGGTVDDPANPRHPEVVIAETGLRDGGSASCSGSLVATTKVLTAAHCFVDSVGRTIVSTATPRPDRPVTPEEGWTSPPPGFVIGTATVHPLYDPAARFPQHFDVAVITLDTPLSGIPFAQLAPVGHLDVLGAQPAGIQSAELESVGYGQSFVRPDQPPRKRDFVSDLTRRYAAVTGKTLFQSDFILANTNYNSVKADGAVCHGDSGGPLLHEGQVVGVSSWGQFGSLCLSWSAWQRVDLPLVRTFLAAQGVAQQ